MRDFFLTHHKRMLGVLLAGAFPIVELCCPEIKTLRLVVLKRSFFSADFIPIYA